MRLRFLPWMVLTLLFSQLAWGLHPNEKLSNVRMLAIYPKNIVVLNRGVEDGVSVGNHAKLLTSEGYAARAICLKTGMLTSHWRIYRIVESEYISKDYTYSLHGIETSEAPEFVNKWQEIDHSKTVPKFDESYLLAPEKAPTVTVKSDLPENLNGYKEKKPKTTTEVLIEDTFDHEKLKRDFAQINGSIFAAPWSTQEGGNNSVENIRYGASISNDGTKYKLDFGFERTSLRASNSDTNDEVINETTQVNTRFTIKDFSEDKDIHGELIYRQARYGEIATPKSHILFAPIGMTKHFREGKTIKKSFFSYAPTYETRTHETLGGQEEDSKGLRHSFRLYLEAHITSDLKVMSDTYYRPRQDIGTWGVDTDDGFSEQKFSAEVKLLNKLSMVYEYQWLDDVQLRRINNLPRIIKTNSINLKYNFDL
jgi:hypothetical protein